VSRDRSLELESRVLEAVWLARSGSSNRPVTVKMITDCFNDRAVEEWGRRVSARYIGNVLRQRLQLHPVKSAGVFVVPVSDEPAIAYLFEKYAIGDFAHVRAS
jgi:hypothetical protein